MEIDLERDGVRRRARVHRRADGSLTIGLDDGAEREVRVIARDENTLLLDVAGVRRRLRWVRHGRELHLAHRGHAAHLHWAEDDEDDAVAAAGSPVVRAPMPGKVLELCVAEGDAVAAGTVVARLEAMKMEISLVAGVAGTVSTVHVGKGDLIEPEAPVVTVEPDDDGS